MIKHFFIEEHLNALKQQGLERRTININSLDSRFINTDGRRMLNFSSNSYLGLHQNQQILKASAEALQQWGSGATSSRLVCGTFDIHSRLENRFAEWKKSEKALLFNSGFQANSSIIPAVADKKTLILSDKLNHASIIDGIRLSGAHFVRYRHADAEDLLKKILKHRKTYKKLLIITETVFSMDGDCAPMEAIAQIAREQEAMLMVDDAHGSGVCGTEGRGPAETILQDIDIHLSTFSKALGSFGAAAACSQEMYSYLMNRARGYIFTTALPAAVVAANSSAIDIVRSQEGDALRHRLQKNIYLLRTELKQAGFEIPCGNSPIVPVITGTETRTLAIAEKLRGKGIFAIAIRPPTVPPGSCRIRLTVSACHREDEIHFLISELKNLI